MDPSLTGHVFPEQHPFTSTPGESDRAATIERAVVLYVDTQRYTVDVMTEETHRPYEQIPFAGLYASNQHPGAALVMPEVGSHCYVMTAGKEDKFILGFRQTSIQEDSTVPMESKFANAKYLADHPDEAANPNFKGYKPPLEPGDIYMGTRDNNRIFVRRGGLIQIESTPLCQSVYVPADNLIRHYCQKYQLLSPLAEISYSHATLTDGEKVTGDVDNTPVLISYNFKRTAQEKVTEGKFTIELRMGQLDANNLDPELDNEHIFANDDVFNKPLLDTAITQGQEGVLSFTVYDHVNAKAVTSSLQIAANGDMYIKATNIHVDADTVFAKLASSLTLEFGTNNRKVELTPDGDIKAYVRQIVLEALSEIVLNSPDVEINNDNGTVRINDSKKTEIDAASILLGSSAPFPVVMDTGWLSKLAPHAHTVPILIPLSACVQIVAQGGTATGPGVLVTATTLPVPGLAPAAKAASTVAKTK